MASLFKPQCILEVSKTARPWHHDEYVHNVKMETNKKPHCHRELRSEGHEVLWVWNWWNGGYQVFHSWFVGGLLCERTRLWFSGVTSKSLFRLLSISFTVSRFQYPYNGARMEGRGGGGWNAECTVGLRPCQQSELKVILSYRCKKKTLYLYRCFYLYKWFYRLFTC